MFDNEWGGAVAMNKVEGILMYGLWVMNNPERLYEIAANPKKGNVGDGECVAIA